MTVRVGFLGAGLIATYHSKLLRKAQQDVVWSGVYDPDPERAERFAAASGAPVCDSEEAVLDGCDAVYICTWTSSHLRLVAAAAERGLAVFCEKPLAMNLADAQAMVGMAATAGIVNQVGLVLRFSPAFCWLRHLVADPEGGRIMSVVLRNDQYIPIQGSYASTWRGDVRLAGAGTLLEHSIHDVDLLELIGGTITSVNARSAEFHGIAGIEDSVAATLTFGDGAVGIMASVWHDILERPSLRRVEVFSERQWCEVEGSDWFGPVRWLRSGGTPEVLEGEALATRVYDVGLTVENPDAAFIAAVRDQRPAQPDFAAALRAHAVVDGLYRSAAEGGASVAVW
jgi:predicted dehydrogenase